MSILIKGMETPKDCWHCPMINSSDECCLLTEEQHDMYEGAMDQVQAAFCPLVEIPSHGRLIDADGEIGVNVTVMPGGKCKVDLIAPIIIPADKED